MSGAYDGSEPKSKLLSALQRLAFSKLLHPRLPEADACCGHLLPCDVVAQIGALVEDREYTTAWKDPEVDVGTLFELEGRLEARARSMLARQYDAPESRPSGRVKLYANTADIEDTQLLARIHEVLPHQGGMYDVYSSHQLLAGRSEVERQLLQAAGVDVPSVATRSGALLWVCAADGVVGVVESEQDVHLFAREVTYRAGLWTDSQTDAVVIASPTESGIVSVELAQAAASALVTHGAAVLHNFLGSDVVDAFRLVDLDTGDAVKYGEQPGAGRGDTVCLPDKLPTVLLARLDELVSMIRTTRSTGSCEPAALDVGRSCQERLKLCRFRSWPMVATYEPGSRYTYHLDNSQRRNGRILTAIYYLNEDWTSADGGLLRLLRPPNDPPSASSEPWPAAWVPSRVMAEVVPTLDTLAIFWSDVVPHEVLPPVGDSNRRAISVWYLCPSQGMEQFVDGSPLPMGGLGMAEAAAEVLAAAAASNRSLIDEETLQWLEEHAENIHSGV